MIDAIDAALAEADLQRVDSRIDRSEPTRRSVYAGPTSAKVFRGEPASWPVFTIKNSTIVEDAVGEGSAHPVTSVAEETLGSGGREVLSHPKGRAVTS